MAGRRQDSGNSNGVDDSLPSLINFGDDDDGLWGFSSSNAEPSPIAPNSFDFGLLEPHGRQENQSFPDLLGDDASNLKSSSISPSYHKNVYPSHGNVSPQSTLDLLSDGFNSNPSSASKAETSEVLNDINLHLASSAGAESSPSAIWPSEGLSSGFSNPFGIPLVSTNLFESPTNHHPNSSVRAQFSSVGTDPAQSWIGIDKLSISQEDPYPSSGLWTEDHENEVSPAIIEGEKFSKDLNYSASQQTRSPSGDDIWLDFGDLEEKGMQTATQHSIETEIDNYLPKQRDWNANSDSRRAPTVEFFGEIHQKQKNEDSVSFSPPPSLEEFVASGGEKGIFQGLTREAIHPGRPAFLELRPHPLRETQDGQAIYTITCTGNRLWAGLECGMRFWDIDKAYVTDTRSSPITGDEDTAPFVFLPIEDSPTTCLFADAAHNVIWSGHRDGNIRAWPIDASSDKVVPKLAWQAHRGPVFSMVVTSYGELWTGSEIGAMRAWPWEVAEKALLTDLKNNFSTDYLMEGLCIDLRSRIATTGASILNTDIKFLASDHLRGRVWSGGPYSLAVWDAQTRAVLKVFGSDGQLEFSSSNIRPVHDFELEGDIKTSYTKFSRKEKIQGPLNFFQRSRNALLGAADAVCRATLGGQFLDDGKKVQAMVASEDGTIWTGYANGLLVHWDHLGNRVQEFQNISVGVHCLCTFQTRLWVGYGDGRVQVMEQDGKLLRGWLAHSSAVVQMAVGGDHVFTLAAHGGIRGWNMTIPSPLESIVRSRLIEMAPTYTRKEHIKVLAGTWNVSQGRASFESLHCWLASPASEASIVVVGLQEMEMGAGVLAMAAAKETVGIEGSANGHWWLDHIGHAIDGETVFVRVGSRQLAGLLIGAWVRKDLLPYVGDVNVGAVACGFGRALGNKGAVAVRMRVFRRTLCVINCHFAAHTEAVARRNADFEHVYQSMVFSRLPSGVSIATNAVSAGVSSAVQMFLGGNVRRPPQTLDMEGREYERDSSSLSPTGMAPQVLPELSESDMIIWLGDFNYRLGNISYEDAINCIKQEDFQTLLRYDQLRKEMKAGRVFQGMREGLLNFPPTYKFDRGEQSLHGYDSSEKRRVPAWCDRILFRDNRSGKSTKCDLSCPVVSSIEWYNACMAITESDHKPVMCMFNLDISFIDEAARRSKYGDLVYKDRS